MIDTIAFWALLFGGATVYWLIPRGRTQALAVASFVYLLTLDPYFAPVLAAWSAVFYFATRATAGRDRRSRLVLGALIAAITTYLAAFKYVPPLISAFLINDFDRRIVLPLGISFFTFKLIHYAIEVSRGNIKSDRPWLFLTYIFLFPIFTAGPIERYDHFLREREDRPTLESISEGLRRILIGLVKKFVIAGFILVPLLDAPPTQVIVGHLDVFPWWLIWRHLFLLFLYSYVDFSAYSDIAIGASRLFGFKIMENFNFPIFAPNISVFWQRWHMSLTGWCRAYVYLPMIGLTRNPYLATYATFVVIGLWHEGSLSYLAWGLYHATGISVYQMTSRALRRRKIKLVWGWPARILGTLATMAFVSAGYAFTEASDRGGLSVGIRILARAFGFADPVFLQD